MNIRTLLKSSIVGGALLFSAPVLAGGYGPAGCGIGTMILGDDATGFMGGLAQYLNVGFWGPTSITLGMFGCGEGGVASVDAEGMEYFVASNDELLAEDSVKNADQSLIVLAD